MRKEIRFNSTMERCDIEESAAEWEWEKFLERKDLTRADLHVCMYHAPRQYADKAVGMLMARKDVTIWDYCFVVAYLPAEHKTMAWKKLRCRRNIPEGALRFLYHNARSPFSEMARRMLYRRFGLSQ